MTNDSYWDKFYSETRTPIDIPSQFAVFFLGEIDGDHTIVDCGCGNGRDSLFFASRGRQVIGIDGSRTAVELCRSRAAALGYANARFTCENLGDLGTLERVLRDRPCALYARFLVHAISDEAEASFLAGVSRVIGASVLAVEFRTARDEQQAKVTPNHFRRFVNPLDFVAKAATVGLHPTYFTEGFGFAKYKQDDAHVARIVLRKSSGSRS